MLAENVLAAWLDLEVASGNDAIASHSEIRKTAKLMGQFLPGTDFITSGYSSMPRYDNMFGGGNYDSHDYDEWLTLQRDWQVDAGIEPLAEADALAVRERAARAVQAVFDELGFPPISDDEVRLATTCLDSRDLPDRDRAADVLAGDRVLDGGDQRARHRPCARRGEASRTSRTAVFDMQRQRVAADYLQTSAIIEPGRAESSRRSTRLTDYSGPGTGYHLEGDRWERLRRLPHSIDARAARLGACRASPIVAEAGPAAAATGRTRSSSHSGQAFGVALDETINGLGHPDVLDAFLDGHPRATAARRGSCASGGRPTSRSSATTVPLLSGSGIAIGLQSKGTALIHRADLQPLDNLELFGMAPSLTLDSYRQIGANAAGYALGRPVAPVPTVLDNYARAKLIVRTTLLHAREAAEVDPGASSGRASSWLSRRSPDGYRVER